MTKNPIAFRQDRAEAELQTAADANNVQPHLQQTYLLVAGLFQSGSFHKTW